ncbi:hypothetical protein SAMN04487967_0957 [Natronorubrum sediminis]|uniref:DUF8048 domain-containing protein n=1 Tax=Natronorubrum sediminis TaxID=640943 RepID=A0A1H6FPD5_9EURY|nr:hypothetical protein [Natronorubrum sediminis]SEH12771.1 hypothetical protein SAMN04487967_0957 [Natronorubrum sediminis]
MPGEPIEGQVLLLAAAKASVPPERLPTLVDQVQATLGPALERYRRSYERCYASDEREVFLVDSDHWADIGAELEFGDRELAAVRRAHEEQFGRIGRRSDREAEFETALEIRAPVCIATGDPSGSSEPTDSTA